MDTYSVVFSLLSLLSFIIIILTLLLLRSSLFVFCTKYSTVQQQTRRGRTGHDVGAKQHRTGRGGGQRADRYAFCFFCIFDSLLSLFILHTSSSFAIIYVRHQEGRSRAVRDVIGPTPAVTTTLDGTAGQVGGGREEKVERWG